MNSLPDTQNEPDTRGIPIQRAGIRNFRFPLNVISPEGDVQAVIATFEGTASLPAERKGVHMSRFVEALFALPQPATLDQIAEIALQYQRAQQTPSARIKVTFPWFFKRPAPVSGRPGLVEYEIGIEAVAKETFQGHQIDHTFYFNAQLATLCPCSKAISVEGAHNQRGDLRIRLQAEQWPHFDTLASRLETCGSGVLYSTLKREDEKFVTEFAYQNPVFVEDLVRNVAMELMQLPGIRKFQVEAENQESIHRHNAVALIEWEA